MTNEQSMWDEADRLLKEHEQRAGKWLRLVDDGDTFEGVFLGGPYPREVWWNEGAQRYEVYGEVHKAAGKTPGLRICLNVGVSRTNIEKEETVYDEPKMMIFEMSPTAYKGFCAVRGKLKAKKKSLQRSFEVTRVGKKNDSKTTYNFLPDDVTLEGDAWAAYEAMELHDLKAAFSDDGAAEQNLDSYDQKAAGQTEKPAAKAASKPASSSASNGELIPGDVSQMIIAILKQLPDTAVQEFCTHFGVQKIRHVPASKAEEAVAFVEQLDSTHNPKEPEKADSPFD